MNLLFTLLQPFIFFLIISTIGGMFAHNALDLFRKAQDKKIKAEGFYEGRTLRAFTLSQDEFK